MRKYLLSILLVIIAPVMSFASEANLIIPELTPAQNQLLIYGIFVCFLGILFGIYQYFAVKKLPAHKSMLDIAQIIFETCKTYLLQQGKFLFILFIFIAICIGFYFGVLQQQSIGGV
ncbi:MAG: sodium/proton-translocating pyrophosphatase, partial [Ignavibacteria bacterium]|nr:sodium/proton-translocating pyrophosphatase [Ignavibacteria bacterium]